MLRFLRFCHFCISLSITNIVDGGILDNKGTEFVIGYMDNYNSGNTHLYVTTTISSNITVQVKTPKYISIINETFTVTSGEVKYVSINDEIRVIGTTLANKGVHVIASDEIVIYGIDARVNSVGGFLGIPTDALGTEYYVITWYPATQQCQLLVVGVNDSTNVAVKLGQAIDNFSVTWNGTDYYKGDIIHVVINSYDTFQLTSIGDLTGTQIISDKIISVFSGNKKTKVVHTPYDHLVEQLPPVESFGKTFATVPLPLRTKGDIYKFVSCENDTSINFACTTHYNETFFIGPAALHQQVHIPSGVYCYITTNKPILMAQFSVCEGKLDSMMTLVTPIELYGSNYKFEAIEKLGTKVYKNYFMFIVKDDEKNGLMVDGSIFPVSTVYTPIPSTQFVGGYIELSAGFHTIHHNSTSSVYGGYLYGTASYESYGFPLGSRYSHKNKKCQGKADYDMENNRDDEEQCKDVSPEKEDMPQEKLSCKCRCDDLNNPYVIHWDNMTPDDKRERLKVELEKIRNELKVNKKKLSSQIRRKQSAKDERMAAQTVGFVGIIILCIMFGLIITPDVWSLQKYILRHFRKGHITKK